MPHGSFQKEKKKRIGKKETLLSIIYHTRCIGKKESCSCVIRTWRGKGALSCRRGNSPPLCFPQRKEWPKKQGEKDWQCGGLPLGEEEKGGQRVTEKRSAGPFTNVTKRGPAAGKRGRCRRRSTGGKKKKERNVHYYVEPRKKSAWNLICVQSGGGWGEKKKRKKREGTSRNLKR